MTHHPTPLCPTTILFSHMFDNVCDEQRSKLIMPGKQENFSDILSSNLITTLPIPSDMLEIKENLFFRCGSRFPFMFASDNKIVFNLHSVNEDRLRYVDGKLKTFYATRKNEITYFIDDREPKLLPPESVATLISKNGHVFIRNTIARDYEELNRNGQMIPCNIIGHPNLLSQFNKLISNTRKRYNDMTDLDFFKKLIVLGDSPGDRNLEKQSNEVLERHMYAVHEDYLFLKEEDTSGFVVPEVPWPNPDFKYILMASDTVLIVDAEDNPAGGIFQKNRFVVPEMRGRGLGVDMVLFGEKNPAINSMAAGFYSQGGFATRKKAFDILKKEELDQERSYSPSNAPQP